LGSTAVQDIVQRLHLPDGSTSQLLHEQEFVSAERRLEEFAMEGSVEFTVLYREALSFSFRHGDRSSEVTLKVVPSARASLDAEFLKAVEEGFGYGSASTLGELKTINGSQFFESLRSHSDCREALSAKPEEAACFEALLRNALDVVYRSWNKGGGTYGSSGKVAFIAGHLVSFHSNWDWS